MTGEKVMPTVEQSAKALFDTHQALTTLAVPFILDGGTLLGFWRDGTFCQDDHDDIDLTCHSRYWEKAPAITEAMLAAGFTVYHEWPRSVTQHQSGQISFKRDNVKIDLMFKEYDQEKGKVWWTIYGGPAGVTYKAVPFAMLNVAQSLKIFLHGNRDLIIGIPQDVDGYLTYRYGEYAEPVHRSDYSCYSTDKAIVKPNAYESI